MSTKHTDGPWEAGKPNEVTDILIAAPYRRRKGGGQVADLIATVSNGLSETNTANARLIAAAPELLAALKAVEERLTAVAQAFYVTGKPAALRVALMDWKQDIEPARAAIRKAEGGAE